MSAFGRRNWLVLIVFGVATLLTFQGSRTLTEHEIFAAEPAREMLAGRGWLLQPFAGEVRTKKPPGQSWLIAASLFVTRTETEWAARLPSALAGFGLAAVVAMIGTRVASRRVALIAGLMTLTCVGVQQRARLAEADMALAFFVAAANAAVMGAVATSPQSARASTRRRPARSPLAQNLPTPTPVGSDSSRAGPEMVRCDRAESDPTGVGVEGIQKRDIDSKKPQTWSFFFWLFIVAGFLSKGPIVLAFTVLPAAVTWAVIRFAQHNRAAATFTRSAAFAWPAMALGVVLLLTWPTAAYLKYPAAAAQWKHEIIDRLRGDTGHIETNRADAPTDSTAASAFATHDDDTADDAAGNASAGFRLRRSSIWSYAWLAPESALPWFPFALPAVLWLRKARAARSPAAVLLICWTLCGLAVVTAIPQRVLHYFLPAVAPLLLLSALGFDRLLSGWLRGRPPGHRRGWTVAAIGGWFGVATIGWGVYNGVVLPKQDGGGQALVAFAAQVDRAVPGGQTLYLYRVGEDRTAYYVHRPLRQTTAIPAARPAYLIAARGDIEALTKAAAASATAASVLVEADKFVARDADGERRVLVKLD